MGFFYSYVSSKKEDQKSDNKVHSLHPPGSVPFSWEQQPGICKTQRPTPHNTLTTATYSQNHGLKLPLPPCQKVPQKAVGHVLSLTSHRPNWRRRSFQRKSTAKNKEELQDPFVAALVECTRDSVGQHHHNINKAKEINGTNVTDECSSVRKKEIKKMNVTDECSSVRKKDIKKMNVTDECSSVRKKEMKKMNVRDECSSVRKKDIKKMNVTDECSSGRKKDIKKMNVTDECSSVRKKDIKKMNVTDECSSVRKKEINTMNVKDEYSSVRRKIAFSCKQTCVVREGNIVSLPQSLHSTSVYSSQAGKPVRIRSADSAEKGY